MNVFRRLQEGPVLQALEAYRLRGGDPARMSACKNALGPACQPTTLDYVTEEEQVAVQGLINGLRDKLDSHPTSIAEDEALLLSDLACRVRTCVECRLDYKRLLQSIVDVLVIWQEQSQTPAGA